MDTTKTPLTVTRSFSAVFHCDEILDNRFFNDYETSYDHGCVIYGRLLIKKRDVERERENQGCVFCCWEDRNELWEQDKFIRDNITENDYLIICIGGNDIALKPSMETQMQMGKLIQMSSAEEVRNNPEAWGFEHFQSIFKTKVIFFFFF